MGYQSFKIDKHGRLINRLVVPLERTPASRASNAYRNRCIKMAHRKAKRRARSGQ